MNQANAPSTAQIANQASKASQKVKSGKRFRWLALPLCALGITMLLCRGVIADYAAGMSAPDGIYTPNATYTFTGHKGGELRSHTFRIYNLRPRRLSVEAQADCGCTSVSWQQTTIPPFGWRDLKAEMRTTGPKSQRSVGIALRTSSSTQKWKFVFLNG